MTGEPSPDELFFTRSGIDERRVADMVGDALRGADDGELFMEYRQGEALAFDDGRLKSASYDVTQGIGLRRIVGEDNVDLEELVWPELIVAGVLSDRPA